MDLWCRKCQSWNHWKLLQVSQSVSPGPVGSYWSSGLGSEQSGIKGSRKKTKKTYFRIIGQLKWTKNSCTLQFWYWSLEGYKLNQSCMAASSLPLQCWRPSHSAGQQHPLWNCSSSCTHHVSSNSAPNWNTHLHELVGIPPRRVLDNHRNRHRNRGPSIHPPAPRSPGRLPHVAGSLELHWRIAPGPFAPGSNGQRALGIWRHPARAACWDLPLRWFHRPQSGPQCNSAWSQGCKVWSEPLHILRSGSTPWTRWKERLSLSWNTDSCLDLEVSINGGTPTYHPFSWVFPSKPSSYWCTPMTMETSISMKLEPQCQGHSLGGSAGSKIVQLTPRGIPRWRIPKPCQLKQLETMRN